MWKNRQPGSLMFQKILFAIICLLAISLDMAADAYLFSKGTSDYTIVVSQDASQSEQTAARELQTYLQQISGVRINISSTPTPKMIHIGWSPATGYKKPDDTFQGFRYVTSDGSLYIYGGRNQGTMYGVYAFLENELGIRWYTSQFTKVPKRKSWKLPRLDVSETPFIQRRLDFYYDALRNPSWCAHNRLNDINAVTNCKYGHYSGYWGIHTFFTFFPPQEYFASHPEYYSFRNGKRIDSGQLCLSNSEMYTLLVSKLLSVIRQNPGYWCYDVSQMDNEDYCQCQRCQDLAEKYGGQSGLMIWFVNKVATEIGKYFPDVMIGTFAYMYTRHAPQNIQPSKNVIVRLCNVECCFSHPLNSTTCAVNTDFIEDLYAWSRLTERIYIWDYVTDFVEYHTPYPNFRVLGPNIRTFGENGVVGLMEEGSHDSPWSEFSELRQWILAKLLWNPDENVDALAREFCMDYYGNAGTDIFDYWQNIQDQVTDDTHIHFNSRCRDMWYSDDFIEESVHKIEKTLEKCSNDTIISKRVKRVLAQMYFVYVCRNYAASMVNGRYRALKEILEEDPAIIRENNYDLDRYLISSGYT